MNNDMALGNLENLISDLEDSIDNNELSKLDISNYKKKRDQYSKKLGITIFKREGSGDKLVVARFYELSALVYFATQGFDMAELELDNLYKFLPPSKSPISKLVKTLRAKGVRSAGHYVPRKMTINEHRQSVGNQTPEDLIKTAVAVVFLGALILLGIVIAYQQLFPTSS